MAFLSGGSVIVCRPVPCNRRAAAPAIVAASPPAIWTPGDSTPRVWLDASESGSLWTTTGKVTPAGPGDPVGAFVQQGGLTPDWLQGTSGRRPFVDAIGAQVALGHDHADDAVSSTVTFPSAGAKSFGIRAQYYSAIGTAETDVLFIVGGLTYCAQVRLGGATSSQPGVSLAADVGGPTVSRRAAGWVPTTDPFSLVFVYKGGGNTTTANYGLWVNRTPITIANTGASFNSASAGYLLCFSITSSMVNGKFSKFCVVEEDKSASVDDIFDWLEA